MPNWCNNNITFYGTEENLVSLQDLLKELHDKQEITDQGQLPDWIDDSDSGWLFHIDVDSYKIDNNSLQTQYETKWAPNTEIIQKIADQFKLDFVYDYEELGCSVYGRVIYKEGILKKYDLTDEFDEYELNEEDDTYTFRGETYESDWEILEILLEEKIEKDDNSN